MAYHEKPREWEMDYHAKPRVVHGPRVPLPHEKPRVVIQPMPTLSFTPQNIPVIIKDLYDTWRYKPDNSLSVALYKIKHFPQQARESPDVISEVARYGSAFQNFYTSAIRGEIEDPGYSTGVQMLESIHNKLCKLESVFTARE